MLNCLARDAGGVRCELLYLRDGRGACNFRLLARLLIFRVNELHIAETDERQYVPQIRLLMIKSLRRTSRTERSAARGDHIDLLALQNSLWTRCRPQNRLARAHHLIDPRLQWRGNREVVH